MAHNTGQFNSKLILLYLPTILKDVDNAPTTHISNWLDPIHSTDHHIDMIIVFNNHPQCCTGALDPGKKYLENTSNNICPTLHD